MSDNGISGSLNAMRDLWVKVALGRTSGPTNIIPNLGETKTDLDGRVWTFDHCPDGKFGWLRLDGYTLVRGDGAVFRIDEMGP